MLFPPFTSPTLLPFFSLCRGLLSCRRRLGERRRPSPATSTHQAGLFPFLCAKSGTADPNVSYLYSDLTQLRAYMCILPANIDFFLQEIIGCAYVHPYPIYAGSAPCLIFWIEFCLQGLIPVLPQWPSGSSKLQFYSPAKLLGLVA